MRTLQLFSDHRGGISPLVLVAGIGLLGLYSSGCAGASGPAGLPSRFADYTPSDVPYDTVYTSDTVDTPPKVRGGMDRLLDAMKYPERARRKDIQGKVWVGFIVRPNGGASHVRVVKSVHPLLDREARRVVKQVRFEPGLKAGTPVPVKMVMPFTFRTRTPFETEGMDGP